MSTVTIEDMEDGSESNRERTNTIQREEVGRVNKRLFKWSNVHCVRQGMFLIEISLTMKIYQVLMNYVF